MRAIPLDTLLAMIAFDPRLSDAEVEKLLQEGCRRISKDNVICDSDAKRSVQCNRSSSCREASGENSTPAMRAERGPTCDSSPSAE